MWHAASHQNHLQGGPPAAEGVRVSRLAGVGTCWGSAPIPPPAATGTSNLRSPRAEEVN